MKKLIMAAVMVLSMLLLFSGCANNSGVADPGADSSFDPASGTAPDASPGHVDDTPDNGDATPDDGETEPDDADNTPDDTEPKTDNEDNTPGHGDAAPEIKPAGKRDNIPFEEGQMYAAAYLGYQTIEDLDYYVERYLDSDEVPIHRVSDGDYYLVIPRCDGMALSLYVNDIETSRGTLLLQEPDCGPFIVQCNVSDIFADVMIRLEYEGETAEFEPFISLENGAVMIGERGLDLTRPAGGEGDPYVGEYLDEDANVPGLEIGLSEDGKYTVQLSIVRLTSIEDGVGEDTGDGIRFTATDAAGDPIGGTITLDGEVATVTITDSTWVYLPDGTTFQFIRSSDTPNDMD